ncbi:MAG: DUF1801 domain-containing protein [Chloroflexota bacterium]
MTTPQTIDEYIAGFPAEVQAILTAVREIIREESPQAEERIRYGMPTFYLHGNLVHFAAFKKHLGFYPTPSGIEEFAEEISPYRNSKGAVQFPLEQPVPVELIRKIVAYRVKENLARAESKNKPRAAKADTQ